MFKIRIKTLNDTPEVQDSIDTLLQCDESKSLCDGRVYLIVAFEQEKGDGN